MLAWTKLDPKKITEVVFVQPKLDGIRCLASSAGLWSRGKKRIEGLKHIEEAMLKIAGPNVWLDGELYKHGASFQEISSKVRRTKNFQDSSDIQYWIYDVITGVQFEERQSFINSLNLVEPLVKVNTIKIPKGEIDAVHKGFLARGFEGSMIRPTVSTGYETGKRSVTLMKNKDFLQEEFVCIGFNKEKHRDRLGSVELKDSKGKTFSARPAMEHSECAELWKDQGRYINKIATVKFFEYTEDGLPRFPSLVGFRDPDDC
jgi:DNA ligase-1